MVIFATCIALVRYHKLKTHRWAGGGTWDVRRMTLLEHYRTATCTTVLVLVVSYGV